MRKTQNTERDLSILSDYEKGIRVRDLVDHHGLTRVRIYTIIREQQSIRHNAPHQATMDNLLRSGEPVAIRDLALPWRTILALEGAGVENSNQLFAAKEHHLRKIRNFGFVSLQTVCKLAKKYGHEIVADPVMKWGTPAPWEEGGSV